MKVWKSAEEKCGRVGLLRNQNAPPPRTNSRTGGLVGICRFVYLRIHCLTCALYRGTLAIRYSCLAFLSLGLGGLFLPLVCRRLSICLVEHLVIKYLDLYFWTAVRRVGKGHLERWVGFRTFLWCIYDCLERGDVKMPESLLI